MGDLTIRPAQSGDVFRVVELIHLGAAGKPRPVPPEPLPDGYHRALARFQDYPGAAVMVAEQDGQVVGTFSLMVLPNISNEGRPVAQIESVHVAEAFRGQGIGEAMLQWAIRESKAQGCWRLQLTSDKRRTDAHRFYRRLGFADSHEGMKLLLDD